MMDTKKIVESAEAKLEGTDMFVVECKCTPSNEIELIIDSDTSISIDACITLSKAIDAEYDREVEDFSLTVASAGIGSELKHLRQYTKLIDSSVEVLLKSGIKVIGKLTEANEQGVKVWFEQKSTVETPNGKKKKVLVEVEQSYSFEEIKYTKEYLDFK